MVEEINELAIIFKRKKFEESLIEEFIPYKVVEGCYNEEEDLFIDSEQNVYYHMASMSTVGNAYAGRRSIGETIKINPNKSLNDIKKIILNESLKYSYYKNIDEATSEYGTIKMTNKETKEFMSFIDKDAPEYYEIYNQLLGEDNTPKEPIKKETEIVENKEEYETFNTPKEVIDEIKKTIKGQDEAVETVVTLLWMHYQYPEIPKSNILIIGPSGCGKTAIFKKIKDLFGVPMTIYGITGTSQTGYKGHDIEEMLANLYYESDGKIEAAENGIIFIDEFDKIAANRDSGDIGTIAIQNELLKLIEGCERTIELGMHEQINMDTTNIIFVCCGAFSNLFEEKREKTIGFDNYPTKRVVNEKVTIDRIIDKGGIIRELAGRLPVIVQLNDLNNNREVLKDILLNSDESIFTSMINAIQSEGITIENLDEVVDLIVDDAIDRKIGARGLISPVRNIFLKIFYEIANNHGKYDKLLIGPNIVKDNTDFELIPKNVKKLTKTKKENLMTN